MTLTIDLPPDLEQELARRAARRGQTLADYARAVLEQDVRDLEGGDAAGNGESSHPAGSVPRRPEGLAEGVVIVGPLFDEPLPREVLARFGGRAV